MRPLFGPSVAWPVFELTSSAPTETGAVEALEPVRQRYNAQHYNLRKFYYECSNLKFLTTLITVPKLPRVSNIANEEVT